jgi:large subunit ribosomal protein L18
MAVNKEQRRLRIRRSIRTKISGTSERPRLSVFRSNKNIYAQIIDDLSGITLK